MPDRRSATAGAAGSAPAACFAQHTGIVGRTGSGKSYAARGIVERWLEEGLRVCIIDPTDCWYGLRANAAGDGPGYPVAIFGGEHGDVAIGEHAGGRLAELVGARNLPCVIATAEMTGGERHRFMTDFLGTLYRRNRTPLHLVLDEADDVAPQNPLPENRRMLGDVDRIVRRGRVRGFRVLMISQRPAVLHKNVLTQASTLVAMRLPAKQDRDAIEGWVKGQADVEQARDMLGSLSGLHRGEGWVWAPEAGILTRQTFPRIATFDSMRTPEHGEAPPTPPTTLAAIDRDELAGLLAEEAVSVFPPANEGAKQAAAAAAAAEERGYRRGYRDGMVAFEGRFNRTFVEAHRSAAAAIEEVFADLAVKISAEAVDAELAPDAGSADGRLPDRAAEAPAPIAARRGQTAEPAAKNIPQDIPAGLPSSAVKMLAVLARGLRLSWAQTATLAGLKARGGHFNAGRKSLRDGGLIVETAEGVAASARGLDLAGGPQPKPAGPGELLTWWRSALPQTAGRVLDQLCRQGGKWVGRDRLAEFLSLQPRGGHWNGSLSILRQNGLIQIKGDKLRAAAELTDG